MAIGQIVTVAGILEAQLMKGDVVPGVTQFAIGTGDSSWNPISPPSATDVGNSLKMVYVGTGIDTAISAGDVYIGGIKITKTQTILNSTSTPALQFSKFNHIMIDNAGVFTVTATASSTAPVIPVNHLYLGYIYTDATVAITIFNNAQMATEIARVFAILDYVDLQGDITTEVTNKIRVTASFSAGVGTGDITEFALFGGTGNNKIIAYKTVQVIHKLSTNILNVVWDLSF